MAKRPSPQPARLRQIVRGVNDNAPAGEACVTDLGAPLPALELCAAELQMLQPLIAALARLAAKRLSATTISSEEF